MDPMSVIFSEITRWFLGLPTFIHVGMVVWAIAAVLTHKDPEKVS
jgi:hypothetical protein